MRQHGHSDDVEMTHPRLLLVFARDVAASGGDVRELRLAVERGQLVRLRRGVYCERWRWRELDDRQRHVLRVHATLAFVTTPAIVCSTSAAAMWGLPVANGWADDVTVLCPYRGGGKSEPGIRRTSAAPTSEHELIDGIAVASLARTFIDIAREQDFASALVTADAILARPDSPGSAQIAETLARTPMRTGRAAAARVLRFASGASESVGESRARGAMIALGFEAPQLQVEFVDREGRMRVDFFWPSVGIVGEFDGQIKYSGGVHGPAEVVAWREKKREDRLRRLVAGVVRMTADDIRDPVVLGGLLSAAGVPRAADPTTGSRTPAREGL